MLFRYDRLHGLMPILGAVVDLMHARRAQDELRGNVRVT
jgi:hypothetical protein